MGKNPKELKKTDILQILRESKIYRFIIQFFKELNYKCILRDLK